MVKKPPGELMYDWMKRSLLLLLLLQKLRRSRLETLRMATLLLKRRRSVVHLALAEWAACRQVLGLARLRLRLRVICLLLVVRRPMHIPPTVLLILVRPITNTPLMVQIRRITPRPMRFLRLSKHCLLTRLPRLTRRHIMASPITSIISSDLTPQLRIGMLLLRYLVLSP